MASSCGLSQEQFPDAVVVGGTDGYEEDASWQAAHGEAEGSRAIGVQHHHRAAVDVGEMLESVVSLTVNFVSDESDEALLTVSVNDEAMGYILINGERANTYHGIIGETVTLQAVANDGYFFTGWSDGVSDATRTIELNSYVMTLGSIFQIGQGINTASMLDNSKVFPNPTSGVVNIEGDDVVRVDVLDVNGRKVASFNNANKLDITNLAAGTYMLRIETVNGTTVKRVVKMR